MLEEKVDATQCLCTPKELGVRENLAGSAKLHRSSPLL